MWNLCVNLMWLFQYTCIYNEWTINSSWTWYLYFRKPIGRFRRLHSIYGLWLPLSYLQTLLTKINLKKDHCVQTDPAKNVWTRAYLIPERNRIGRRQEEGKNSVYLFVFCMNLGEINALLAISCCQMKHFGYVIVY
jgi:hypothetical protein